jgi:hypothetical protein
MEQSTVDKLTVTRLGQKCPAFGGGGDPEVHHRVHNSPPAFPILSQVKPLHILQLVSSISI